MIDVTADGALTAAIVNGRGDRVYELELRPEKDHKILQDSQD